MGFVTDWQKWSILAAIAMAQHSPLALAEGPARPKTAVVEFKGTDGTQTSIGEILVDYADGSMLLLTPDGQLWTLKSEDVLSVEQSDQTLQPATSEEIYAQFRESLPPGFAVHKTKHYVLVYNTSKIYVEWAGNLYEDLHRRFYNYWKSRGIRLDEPRFPLVAVVFSNKASYLEYAHREIGDSAKAMIGYYNIKTNRMITYDLTGVDGLVPNGYRVSSATVINQILSQPQAERTVSTIIHEAVHQLSFNSGLQVRLADNPLWVSEGMAMYFEAPDGNNRVGWGALGKVNYHNFRLFMRNLPSRPANSLPDLITDDSRLQNGATAGSAYPESWALTYFLMKARNKQYVGYIRELSQQAPLEESKPRERLELFKQHFGDPQELEQDFLKYMTTHVR